MNLRKSKGRGNSFYFSSSIFCSRQRISLSLLVWLYCAEFFTFDFSVKMWIFFFLLDRMMAMADSMGMTRKLLLPAGISLRRDSRYRKTRPLETLPRVSVLRTRVERIKQCLLVMAWSLSQTRCVSTVEKFTQLLRLHSIIFLQLKMEHFSFKYRDRITCTLISDGKL